MEWMESLRTAIDFMERNLMNEIDTEDVAEEVHISSFYLQRGFKFMTGYSIGEYIRCRRLYLAALDVIAGREKVIDLAYKYGYSTPEGFTKAFSRFHGVSPQQMKNDFSSIKTFQPLKIKILIQGGNDMDYTVEKAGAFQIIGFEREFSFDSSYENIPMFWREFQGKYMTTSTLADSGEEECRQAVCACEIGEFGVCIDDVGEKGKFRYMIAGTYQGGAVPKGMTVFDIPEMEWAKFRCTGPMPEALQAVNTQIFQEWLPGNPEYEVAMGINIEKYAKGDCKNPCYESEIWIPVKRK